MTLYPDRQSALKVWRETVRDSAAIALFKTGGSMPLSELAPAIGVALKGLHGLLEADQRFTVSIAAGQGGKHLAVVRLKRAV